MSIRIVTDSGSYITQAEARQWGIEVLPLKSIFGEEEFTDGVTITHREFYERLAKSPVSPTTSQVTPAQYEAVFQTASDAGDEVICITLASLLSGCHQSAVIASDGLPTIHIVDSLSACVGERVLVQRAIALRDEGRSASEITDLLEQEKSRIRVYALLDTLEYLKRGGRISSTAALAGTLLNIKPLISVIDGTVTTAGKARGAKKAGQLLTELIQKHGIDRSRPFCFAYSGAGDDQLRAYIAENEAVFGAAGSLPVSSIGSVIGTHTGPGVVGLGFFAQEP